MEEELGNPVAERILPPTEQVLYIYFVYTRPSHRSYLFSNALLMEPYA